MRIGIYVDVAKEQQPTGIGLHIRNLVDALARIDHDNEYLLYYQRGVFADRTGLPMCPRQANFRPRPVRFPGRWVGDHPRLWWDWWLPRCLRKDRIDVFHGPNHFLPAFDRARSVVTIHDIAYFRLDAAGCQSPMLRTWTRKALDRAATVIALSENTRADIESLGVESGRIQVIYGGANVVAEENIAYARAEELKARLGLPPHFILFVGSLLPRKNVPFLLRSFARLKADGSLPHKLVLAGHRDKAAEEVERLCRELGIADDVLITGYVENWELPLLYKLADVFVLPTLYEGFTLVTLEAMHYGTPVIATDTSSIREGTGDAAQLVPVNDDAALAGALDRVLRDDGLRRQMVERGKVQARKFTWEQCAQDTLSVYTHIAQAAADRRVALVPSV